MSVEPVLGVGPNIGIAILLLIGSAFFVGGEYALVSVRRSKLESMAKKGNHSAKEILKISDNVSPFIAGTQIGITMIGVAMGSFTEPFVTDILTKQFSSLDHRISTAISFTLVLFVLVILGELIPKYVALKHPERFIFLTYRTLGLFVKLFTVIIWIAQTCSQFILKPFKINIKDTGKESIGKEELVMMIQATSSEGVLEKAHADLVSRALRMDALAARDIMVHRLDIKWLDVDLSLQEVLSKMAQIRYSRVPVCRGDIDDIVGIVYTVDLLRAYTNSDFDLEKLARPFVAIPENLPMERIVQTMRESNSQIVIVLDEYGGTSGIITLEDIVEELFGEIEDEHDQDEALDDKEIEPGKYLFSARLDVVFINEKYKLNIPEADSYETLGGFIVNTTNEIPEKGEEILIQNFHFVIQEASNKKIDLVILTIKE